MVNLRLFPILREVFMSDVIKYPRPLSERIFDVVRLVNGYVLTVLAFALVVCVVWQVLSRYTHVWADWMPLEFLADLLRKITPSTKTEELAKFMFMWIGLLGAAQASAYKQHLAIDLLAMKLQGSAKRALNVVIECCIIVFAALVMVKGGLALTMDTLAKHQQTSVLQWPMGYVYMVVPVAGALMVLFAVVAIIRELSNRTGGAA